MTQDEIKKILEAHKKWFFGEVGGVRADLSGANLYRANLYRANLSGANLSGANLYRANLSGANLSGAKLYRADLSGANLYRANLSGADLSGANLYRAKLSGANLYRANLSGAKLSDANLYRADLSGADYELLESFTTITSEGALIGWKKCRDDVIVKLRIPEDARRSNATGRKCRAEFVDVLEVFGANEGVSQYNGYVSYRKGERVTCDSWCDDRFQECAGGIHFFLTRLEAERY